MSNETVKPEFTVKTSYLSTVVSMSLVLFLLGIVSLLVLTSNKLSVIIKENITFSLYLKNEMKEVDVMKIKKNMDKEKYSREVIYISKEEAAKTLQQELDPEEDFIKFLDGYNPLPSSIDIRLKAEYANPDSIARIETQLLKNPAVVEVVYQKSLIHLINENINKISIILLIFSGLLFTVSVALINNTIRLSIYSKRFLIRTMQLVGATPGFIRKPFLMQGLLSGLYGSFIAIVLLTGIIFWLYSNIPDLFELHDADLILSLFIFITAMGLVLSLISTYLAVRRYIDVRTQELY